MVWKLLVESGKILYREFILKVVFYMEEKTKLFGKGGGGQETHPKNH